MELEIKWTREDIERKLRAELKQSGFRPIEVDRSEEGDKTEKRRRRRQTFTWAFKPQITVRVKAEPDPDAVLDSEEDANSPAAELVDTTENEPADVSVDTPLDPTLLPPGTAEAIERAVKTEKKGKKIRRRKLPGETNERPY